MPNPMSSFAGSVALGCVWGFYLPLHLVRRGPAPRAGRRASAAVLATLGLAAETAWLAGPSMTIPLLAAAACALLLHLAWREHLDRRARRAA